MSLSDKEKTEIAEVVALVLDSRMKELYSQIARGFVEISNGMMEDLADILDKRNTSVIKKIEERRNKLEEKTQKGPIGF
jgi:hypothetical protein